ncbi:MAG: enoyl-CoA hydratase/isomerase family protein [Phycisphaerales bacterium]|nr:enoyl-CoA hydratase/isomerase family protein [Phycisphaerales bacterium]
MSAPRAENAITNQPLVRIETHDAVTVILLSRVDKRNAMTPTMLDELLSAIDHATTANPCRALILSGDGPIFCGGFDLKLCHQTPGTLKQLLTKLASCIQRLRSLDIPVIIAAQGGAIAGAAALLSACDFALSNREATIGYPVVPLGISPAVSAPTLSQRVGKGGARRLQLDPGLITGEEAARLGLIDICCDIREDVLPRAQRLARELISKPAHAYAATKLLLRELEELSGSAWSEEGLNASLKLADNPDQQTRLGAIWNKPKS